MSQAVSNSDRSAAVPADSRHARLDSFVWTLDTVGPPTEVGARRATTIPVSFATEVRLPSPAMRCWTLTAAVRGLSIEQAPGADWART
jgi:hypothetical protein